jgi:hypothetical protein
MLLSFDRPDRWTRVSRIGGGFYLAFYFLFLLYAWRDTSGFLFLDFVNLMIHEAGHLFFTWGGNTIMLLGGTLGELIVPALCAVFFWFHRQTYGLAFCVFWFFENFLYIGTYMADARTSALPLVNGDESDWTLLFGQWKILTHDQQIGHFMRTLGWLGMFGAISWLAYRLYRDTQPESKLRPLSL